MICRNSVVMIQTHHESATSNYYIGLKPKQSVCVRVEWIYGVWSVEVCSTVCPSLMSQWCALGFLLYKEDCSCYCCLTASSRGVQTLVCVKHLETISNVLALNKWNGIKHNCYTTDFKNAPRWLFSITNAPKTCNNARQPHTHPQTPPHKQRKGDRERGRQRARDRVPTIFCCE